MRSNNKCIIFTGATSFPSKTFNFIQGPRELLNRRASTSYRIKSYLSYHLVYCAFSLFRYFLAFLFTFDFESYFFSIGFSTSPDIFLNASEISKVCYFCFTKTGWTFKLK